MGMQLKYINYIERHVSDRIGDIKGRSMLELGDQVLKGMKKITQFKTGKEYFTDKGVDHISIDLNGRHRAIKLDLAKPITHFLEKKFDIITNLGTTEHVEPWLGQYQCFKNIHELLAVGGIVVHIVPDFLTREADHFHAKHANNYYKEEFFRAIYNSDFGFELIDLSRNKYNFFVCAKKIVDKAFIEDRDLFFSTMIRSEGGKIWKGINDCQ